MFYSKAIKKLKPGIFSRARLKLTAWYFLIIAAISITFSAAIYQELASELDRVQEMQRIKIENRFPPLPSVCEEERNSFYLDPILVNETKTRLGIALVIINAVILTISTGGGYFLAGKTLKPISDMVDDQNRFISDASHELRTPITSIKTEIEVGLRDKKMDLRAAKKLIRSNLEEVDRIHKLTNNLLFLNKAEATGVKAQKINLKDITEAVVKKLKPVAAKKKVAIQKKLKNAQVFGDESSLTEITTILMDNAIKYSQSGKRIIVNTRMEKGKSILEVQDFGMGIDPSDLPHIFDRFYRAELSRNKDKTDGFGLGLAIAKNIVENHKGEISVTSAPGKGSLFTVSFPVRSV